MAFEILAKLGLNATGFQSGLKRAESAGVAFASALKTKLATIFSTAAVGSFAKSILQAADSIGDLSDQTGLTVDEIQELIAIASKSGIEFPALQSFIEKLREARREAMSGKEDIKNVFEQIGISSDELAKTKDPGDLLRKFAIGFSKFDEESRNTIAATIGGTKGGPRLSAALSSIGKGEKSGEIKFTSQEVKAASEFDNSISSFNRQLKAFVFKLLQPPEEPIVDPRFSSQIQKAAASARKEPEKPKEQKPIEKVFVPFKKEEKTALEKETEIKLGTFTPSISALQQIGAESRSRPIDFERQSLRLFQDIKRATEETAKNIDSTRSYP